MKINYKSMIIVSCIMFLFNISSVIAEQTNLQSIVLEDFELAADKPKRSWVAIPCRFGRKEGKETGESLIKVEWVKSWPEAGFGREGAFDDGNGPKEYKYCLGVEMEFMRRGYNYIELYPVGKNDAGEVVKKPIPFVGKVRQLDLWVWGANYNYDMEVVIQDYKGYEHRLPIGNIRHAGWKNFTIQIPSYIPQVDRYVLGDYAFSLVKIVIWTNPKEKVSKTFVYLDHIKYLTDILTGTYYDGYNLGQAKEVEKLWNEGKTSDEVVKETHE